MVEVATIVSGLLMLTLLCSAVGIDQRNDPLKRGRVFLRRRLVNWVSAGFLYASFYSARYNYSIINTPDVRELLGVGKETFGLLFICGKWTYAFCQIFCGIMADRLGGKTAILIGACGVALFSVVNAVLFMSGNHSFGFLVVLYALNNTLQPLGSLSTLKINSAWYYRVERGVFSGVFGCMISFGYYLALVVGGLLLGNAELYWEFLGPSLLVVTGMLAVLIIVKDEPAGAGHRITPEYIPETQAEREATWTQRLRVVLANKRIQVGSMALFAVGWTRGSFLDWLASYLDESVGMQPGSPAFTVTTSAVSICGILGSMVGGVVSDRCCGSKRSPVCLAYFLCQIVCLAFFLVTTDEAAIVVLCGAVSFFLFGTLTLLMASAPADFAGSRQAGTASAVMNFGQYIGSGIASFATGWLVDAFGWGAWLGAMIPAACIGVVCMVVLLRMWKTHDEHSHMFQGKSRRLSSISQLDFGDSEDADASGKAASGAAPATSSRSHGSRGSAQGTPPSRKSAGPGAEQIRAAAAAANRTTTEDGQVHVANPLTLLEEGGGARA